MSKYEYYWVKLHKSGEKDKELQNEDYFALMGVVNRHLIDGWVITYMKLMNRKDET